MDGAVMETPAQPIRPLDSIPVAGPVQGSQLLAMAIERGASIELIERLMAMADKADREAARKAYVAALARAKAQPFKLRKTKAVGYTTDDGKFVGYQHVDLAAVVDLVTPALAENDIVHAWEVQQQEGGRIRVTCVLTHAMGHSERAAVLEASPDQSGKKNNIQAMGSTVTYLQRYTLMAAMGIAAANMDDDGGGPGGSAEPPELTRLLDAGEAAAANGMDAYRKWWATTKPADRKLIGHERHNAMVDSAKRMDAAAKVAKAAEGGAA